MNYLDNMLSRGMHNEIMDVINCFSQNDLSDVFAQILDRGNHEEIIALLNLHGRIHLQRELSFKLIDRGNHEEIMTAIYNRCFAKSSVIDYFEDVFSKILDRDNHEEIMAFFEYPNFHLDNNTSARLIERNNKDEILKAIRYKCFTCGSGLGVYGFENVLELGDHELIMAFLDYPGGIHLDAVSTNKLIDRGDHDEIIKGIQNFCFTDTYSGGLAVYGTLLHYAVGSIKIIKRGNHEEIMALIRCLGKIEVELNSDASAIFCNRNMTPEIREEFEYALRNRILDNIDSTALYARLYRH